MQSRYLHLKNQAIILRKKGHSIRSIETQLKIPRSTLSGWFSSIFLKDNQQKTLKNNWSKALVRARVKATIWHNEKKRERICRANDEAVDFITAINIMDSNTLEIALAFLYLGEGSKTGTMSLGSSNVNIVKFYISCLWKLYSIDQNSLRFDLHLRYDQDPLELKKFWAQNLGISIQQIRYCAFDIRTKGKPTFKSYKGVCLVSKGEKHIQRRLLEIARVYSSMVTKSRAISSVGRAFD